MKRKFILLVLSVFLVGMMQHWAAACTSVSPPVPPTILKTMPSTFLDLGEGSTRLHSDLLTEASPIVWWNLHKKEVLTRIKERQEARPYHIVQEIKISDINRIAEKIRYHHIADCGEYKEYLEFLLNNISSQALKTWNQSVTAVTNNTKPANAGQNPGSTSSFQNSSTSFNDYMKTANRLATNVRNYGKYVYAGKTVEELHRGLEKRMYARMKKSERLVAQKIFDSCDEVATYQLAWERVVMSNLWKEFPERVFVDAVLNIIYLNPKTAKRLPEANWHFFYAKFNRKYSQARNECEQILKEGGLDALPYIRRAISELESTVKEKDKKGRSAVQRTAAGASVSIHNRLIPMAIDFAWVFGGQYDTNFYRNKTSLKRLKRLRDEIKKQAFSTRLSD